MSDNTPSERLFLIDGSGYIYRAFYALRNFSRRDGFPTNAIFGFVKMLRKLIETHKPERLAVIFDSKGPTFRHQLDPEYKANRKTMPDELRIQIPVIQAAVEAYRIPSFQLSGYEADDLLGTLAVAGEQAGLSVVIVTGDKDLMQMVSPHISLLDPGKEQWIHAPEVMTRWGVEPEKVTQVMALAGDTSDNIPGVPKIGQKTAAQLIQTFGNLDNLLNNLDQVHQPMRRRNLTKHGEQARLSLRLVTIDPSVPLEFSLEDLRRQTPDQAKLRALFMEMEFTSLVREMDRATSSRQEASQQQQATSAHPSDATTHPEPTEKSTRSAPPPAHEAKQDYQVICNSETFQRFLEELKKQPSFSIDTETTNLNPALAELVGLSFSWANRQAVYLPLNHTPEAAPNGQLRRSSTLSGLKPVLENPKQAKIGQNIKYDYIVLKKHGIHLAGIAQDTMLFSHLLYGTSRRHNLDAIAMDLLQRTTTTFKELVGTGKKQRRFDQVPLEQAAPYACEDAEVTWEAAQKMAPLLTEHPSVWRLYEEIERPLIEVLAEMELAGVLINRVALAAMSSDFTRKRKALVEEIYALAGETFNVNSPQQLGEILFTKMAFKGGKRTKTGYATDVAVLTALAEKGHELPERVLRYRTLTKLQSTYTDALPKLINPTTLRVHTSYNQAVTMTGRLSSSDPNLQNIPVRHETGRAIRAAFIAPSGWLLLSADYSQIELRLLAHLGQVERLCEAFHKDQDIHAATALELFGSQAFNAPTEQANDTIKAAEHLNTVDPEARRMAKTINFGLVYGMSPYGLAKRLGISNKAAKNYMEIYFQRYQGVRAYMDQNITFARDHGYVETMGGRRCYLKEINNSNRNLRELAERTAINAPLQGSAADLIKIAMIRLQKALLLSKLRSRMVLQVHDELVLEVPKEELEPTKILVREAMEKAIPLSVPLKVDMGVGQNWAEAH